MEPFPLSDSRWKSYQGGYRQPFDARPLVEALHSSPNDRSLWDTVWNELHHQGDIGEASYAFVTHLPSLITQAEQPIEQALAFAAVVEQQRCVSNNPPLPPELDRSYHAGPPRAAHHQYYCLAFHSFAGENLSVLLTPRRRQWSASSLGGVL